MEKTKFQSYKNGELARGCQMCVRGRSLVLFITGICPLSCYFCPLSEKKYHKDVIYANERPITDLKDIIEEARLSGARACGITGGDPLAKLERTIRAIKLLKKAFKNFYIHLYTPLELVTPEKIRALEEAGLDEIRFHLDFKDRSLWEKVRIKTTMLKGVEVPCVPGEDLHGLISFVTAHVDFINLNELEYSDAVHNKIAERGFKTKSDLSYGIAGSEELALEMLEKFSKVRIHYCTTRLKDSVQMMNRIALRAKNVRKAYDVVQGPALLRAAIYGDEDLDVMHEKVSAFLKNDIDLRKKRLLCGRNSAKQHLKKLKKLGYRVELVEELATYDLFEIESEVL